MSSFPNQTSRVLLVSREPSLLRVLRSLEAAKSWHLESAMSGWDAMEAMQSGTRPILLVLDIARADVDSLHFLRWLRRMNGNLPVALICYPDELPQAQESIQGSGEILVRPFESKQIEAVIRRQLAKVPGGAVVEKEAGFERSMRIKNDSEATGSEDFFLGASLVTQKLRAQAALMAKTDVPMLILGERGAGKFAVASLIHSLSVRSGFELRRLQCAETPESVLAAELFGDATEDYDERTLSGKSALGEQGTVFLDEITALPASLQKRLAQLLEKDERRNAASDANSASMRILAASSANLDRAVAENRLREDLYYRLSAFTVQVPPLRQRKEEIALLLCYFMHKLAKHYSLSTRGFSAPMVAASRHYGWPGNLKEMETFVKRYLLTGDEESALRAISEFEESATVEIAHHARPQVDRYLRTAVLPRPLAEQNSYPESLKSLIQGVKSEAEQNAIGAALRRTGWNRKAAARLLRVSYRTLLYKIDQYHMRAPEPYFSALPGQDFSDLEEVKGSGKAS